MSREAVSNLNQCSRVRTDRDGAASCGSKTLPWTAAVRKERSFAGRGKRVEATSTDDPHGAKSKNYDDARFAHNRGTFERSRLTRATDPLRAAWPAQSASLKFN